MKNVLLFVVFVFALAASAAEPNLDSEKILTQAKNAAAATAEHQAAVKNSGIEAAALALAEERKKPAPDHTRIAELAENLANGMKKVADVDPVIDTLDSLREGFHDAADQLRSEAERGLGSGKQIAEKLAAPYEAKLRALAARIKDLPEGSPQSARFREEFAFNLAMRDEARKHGASARSDTGVDLRGLAEKYDRAATAVLITKRELLARSMKLAGTAEQLQSLASMTKAAKALDDSVATLAELGKATDTSLKEVDATMRLLDRTFDGILARVSAGAGSDAVELPVPAPEVVEQELRKYQEPPMRYTYDRGTRGR